MLEKMTAKDFAPLQDKSFTINFDPDAPSVLKLIEVSERGSASSPESRRPFSLVFRGDKNCLWPQGIYPVEHPELEKMQLFLVPIGPDEHGMCYEAVFN